MAENCPELLDLIPKVKEKMGMKELRYGCSSSSIMVSDIQIFRQEKEDIDILYKYHHLKLYPLEQSDPQSTKKPVVVESYDEVVKLKEVVYVSDKTFVLHDVDDEEKEIII
ncbi:unnamed protein product [Amaranthus hypochondriacus]